MFKSEERQSAADVWYDIYLRPRIELVNCMFVGIVFSIIGVILIIVWLIAGIANASGGQEYREIAFNVYFAIFVLGIVVGLPAWIKLLK